MWFWFFVASVCVNVFMLFYVRWLLSSLAAINTDVENVSEVIKEFVSHLDQIHELEMFYGDETLKSLIDHANVLSETLKDIDLLLQETEEDKIAEET